MGSLKKPGDEKFGPQLAKDYDHFHIFTYFCHVQKSYFSTTMTTRINGHEKGIFSVFLLVNRNVINHPPFITMFMGGMFTINLMGGL